MLSAVIGRFRPVKLPFCIFGLADLTVSKVFFSSLPLRKEVSHQDRAENNALSSVAVLVLAVLDADRVMLVMRKEKLRNPFRSEYLRNTSQRRSAMRRFLPELIRILFRQTFP